MYHCKVSGQMCAGCVLNGLLACAVITCRSLDLLGMTNGKRVDMFILSDRNLAYLVIMFDAEE